MPLDQPALGYFALDTVLKTLLPPAPPAPAPGDTIATRYVYIAAIASFAATALAAIVLHKFVARKAAAVAAAASGATGYNALA